MMTLAYVTRRADTMTARLRKLNAYVEELHNLIDDTPNAITRSALLKRATRGVETSKHVSNRMMFYVRQRSRMQVQA